MGRTIFLLAYCAFLASCSEPPPGSEGPAYKGVTVTGSATEDLLPDPNVLSPDLAAQLIGSSMSGACVVDSFDATGDNREILRRLVSQIFEIHTGPSTKDADGKTLERGSILSAKILPDSSLYENIHLNAVKVVEITSIRSSKSYRPTIGYQNSIYNLCMAWTSNAVRVHDILNDNDIAVVQYSQDLEVPLYIIPLVKFKPDFSDLIEKRSQGVRTVKLKKWDQGWRLQ